MKKLTIYSTIWLAIAIITIIGTALAVVGFTSGASTTLYIDKNGIHRESEATNESHDTGEIKKLDINASSAHIDVIASDKYGYEIISRTGSNFDNSYENGTLKIKQRYGFRLNIFSIYTGEDVIKVYLPADALLGDITVKNSSGKVNVDSINSDNTYIRIDSGKAQIENTVGKRVKVDVSSGNVNISNVKAENFDVVLSSGKINADRLDSNGLNLYISSGKANLSGKLGGTNRIKVSSGTVNMDITGDKSSYSKILSVDSGSIKIDGVKTKTGEIISDADNSLDISINSGRANINFTK